MKLFKSDFTRFFAFGFAGGALLVLAALGIERTTHISDGIVPPAHAAQADR